MLNRLSVAISGKSGCGNSSVSRLVAERLSLRLINYTFRSLAEERGMSFEEFSRLAEVDTSYDLLLDRRQREMASEGNCVLGSRLAIWILRDATLKVYLTASIEVRAARIARREGKEIGRSLEETVERDRLDRARYLALYGIDNDQYDFADLVIDTEAHDEYSVAGLIAAAAHGRLKA